MIKEDLLIEFIESHSDWKEQLKKAPYFLKIKNSETHPNYWMLTYNLFDSDFTNNITKTCRGIVLDIDPDTNKVLGIVNYAMSKFFNYGDPNCAPIDWATAKVLSKKDGQLIRVSKYKGEIIWCTNGAFGLNTPVDFTDDKVHDYVSLVRLALNNDLSWIDRIPEGVTVFMELCSPYNRIICRYSDVKMWLLGARSNVRPYSEIMPEDIKAQIDIPLDIPESYDLHSIESVLKELDKFVGYEQEGVVVRDAAFNRIKVKSKDYLRIHYMLGENGITQDSILTAILTDSTDDLLEFDPSLSKNIDALKKDIIAFEDNLRKLFSVVKEKFDECNKDRKTFAQWAISQDNTKTLFRLLDCKDVEDLIKENRERMKNSKKPTKELYNCK